MVKYENDCCGCATLSYPCIGSACPYMNVPHLYCDKCKEEVEELYEYDEKQVCADCILEILKKVEV